MSNRLLRITVDDAYVRAAREIQAKAGSTLRGWCPAAIAIKDQSELQRVTVSERRIHYFDPALQQSFNLATPASVARIVRYFDDKKRVNEAIPVTSFVLDRAKEIPVTPHRRTLKERTKSALPRKTGTAHPGMLSKRAWR